MAEMVAAYRGRNAHGLAVRSRAGEGLAPVVLLHGWGDTKQVFDCAFESAALQGHGLLSIDLLGFGRSDKPHDFSYSIEDQAEVVAGIIEQKFPQGAHIVGHSMGGLVGMIAAHELHRKALSFTSVEGNLTPQDTSEFARRMAHMPTAAFRFIGHPAIGAALLTSSDKANRAWGGGWLAASPRALQRSALSLEWWSDAGALVQLFQQTPRRAYIGGEGSDRFVRAQSLLSPEEVHGVATLGHVPMRTNPAGFYQTLGSILSREQA